MRTKLFILLFLTGSIIPNLLFAQFTQQGPKLVGTGASGTFIRQGISIAITPDGNTAIEGGQDDATGEEGAVWVFTRSGTVWTQQGPKLVGTGTVGSTVHQGASVSISADGNTAIEGGYSDNNGIGAVWIFTRSGGVWTQQGPKLVGTGVVGTFAGQGSSVSLSSDGNTAIVGGDVDNNSFGAVWVFTRSGGVWTQQGPKLVGTGAVGSSVYQGRSVSVSSDGNTFVVGGYQDNNNLGAVWVFTRSGGVWTQQGPKLVGTGSVGSSVFQGISVSISSNGNTIIVGGDEDNNNLGAVWVFTRSGSVWTQQGTKLVGTGSVGSSVYQGRSVAISGDGNTVIEGGFEDNTNAGAVWVFTRSGNVWTQLGTKLVGTGAVGSSIYQGASVAISLNGSTAVEGGIGDNTSLGAIWVFYNPTTSVRTISGEVPKEFSLLQNYPNPFNPSTKIKFDIPLLRRVSEGRGVSVKLTIFDILGREAAALVNQQLQPGSYEVTWDASNMPSGVYFYKLESDGFTETKKMLIIK
jgi:hypothetical protein